MEQFFEGVKIQTALAESIRQEKYRLKLRIAYSRFIKRQLTTKEAAISSTDLTNNSD